MGSESDESTVPAVSQSARKLLVATQLGSLLTWLAFPPVGWSVLAFFAPVLWLMWIAPATLPGRHPYRIFWLAGFTFWLLSVHWIRLPHPLNYLAWVVLASYLGVYLPLFVALARVGVHRMKMPLWLVAPVVWTGLDWLRGYLMTGFGMGSLAHTQAGFHWIVQLADVVGEYGVTFLILCIAGSITTLIAPGQQSSSGSVWTLWVLPLTRCVCLLALACLYGLYSGWHESKSADAVHSENRIILIQGNYLADWKFDTDKQRRIMDEQLRLSDQAVRENRDADLLIWPETSFRQTLVTVEDVCRART